MTDTSLPPAPRFLDRHFRWRGASVSRLESFTDAVFAIVLALLFLRAVPPETFADLGAAMKALVPFAATFTIVAYLWVEHWLFSRRYDLQDGVTTLLNLVLLFLLLFYTYPMKFLFTLLSVRVLGPIGKQTWQTMMEGHTGDFETVRLFVIYGVGYGAIWLVLALLYLRAHRLRDQLALNAVESFLTRSAVTQCLIQAGVALISVAIALCCGIAWGIPGWVYFAIGPLMAVHGTWQGRHLGRLLAAA